MQKIYVVEQGNKQRFIELNSKHKLNAFKVYSKEEFINKYFEDIIEVHFKLIEKCNLSYEDSLYIAKYLPFVNEENAKTNNLKKILSYKQKLIQDNQNKLFQDYLKDKEIIFYHLKNDLRLDLIKRHINVKEEKININNDNKIEVYEFNNIEEEIIYFLEEVSNLINNNIPINKIKYILRNKEYRKYLDVYADLYNLKFIKKTNIFGRKEISDFLKETIESKSFEKAYVNIDDNSEIKSKLLNIINSLVTINEYSFETKLKILEYKLDKLNIVDRYENMIEEVDVDYETQDEHIFILGFNNEDYPRKIRNNELLSSVDKSYIHQNSIIEEIDADRKQIQAFISNNDNLYFSYSKKIENKDTLISKVNQETKIKKYFYNDILYSKKAHKIRLAKSLDKLRKYKEKNDELDKLYNSLTTKYNTYIHQYNGSYKPEKLRLSYSTLNHYNMNPFSYYVTHVLGIDKEFDVFLIDLGSFLHEIMERCIKDHTNRKPENYLDIKEELINKYNFNKKQRLYIDNFQDQILKDIEFVNSMHIKNKYDLIEFEKKCELQIEDNVSFIGYIDKFIVKDGVYMIVDYKKKSDTASKTTEFIEYGINAQLITYIFLTKAYNYKFGGVFLNALLLSNVKDDNTSFDLLKEKNLKLNGFVTNNLNRLSVLDNSILSGESNYMNININKDGTLRKNQGFDDEGLKEILSLLEDRIQQNIKDLKEGKFDIAPLIIDAKNPDAYEASYYRDISYLDDNDDFVYVNTTKRKNN